MANQFNAEVFDCGLLNNQSRISVAGKKLSKPKSGYRIFRAGDQTPTSDDESQLATSIRDMDMDHIQEPDHRKGIFSFHESSSDYESEEEAKPHKKSLAEFLHLSLPRKKQEKAKSNPSVSVTKDTKRESVTKESPATTPKERTSLFRKNSFKDTSAYFKDLLTPGRRSSIGSNNSDSLELPVSRSLSRSSSDVSLEEKYGDTSSILGRGSFATVKLCCPINSKEKYAVKEFRRKRKEETQKEYIKKLQAEFCIASSMDNENIVKSVDLIQDQHHHWCVVMEYCQGGDLFSRISNGTLSSAGEKNCYLVQMIHGVQYLHSIGVAHRDLKPENLLLSADGHILKITDFGVSTVFKQPFGNIREKRKGVAGSGPYIAPEEFGNQEYDSELVDLWSIGVIAYVMNTNTIPWQSAISTDPRFKNYLECKRKFKPFERLEPGLRTLLYLILDPNPATRITMDGILKNEWVASIDYCSSKHYADTHTHEATISRRR